MKERKEYSAKQHNCYRIGLWLAFPALLKQKVFLLPAPITPHEDLAQLKEKLDLLEASYASNLYKRKGYQETFDDSKDRIIRILTEEVLDEKYFSEMTDTLKQSKKNLDIIEKEIRIQAEQVDVLKSNHKKTKQLVDDLNDGKWLLRHHFQIADGHMFLHGTCQYFDVHCFRINTDPEKQIWRGINLVKLFPEWSMHRIIYFFVFLRLISDDDLKNNVRRYDTGLGLELFAEVYQNNFDFWYRTLVGEESAKFFQNCAEALDTWLAKPLSFEELLLDPLFRAHVAYRDAAQLQATQYHKVFKGGPSTVAQILEFLLFITEFSAKEKVVLEV